MEDFAAFLAPFDKAEFLRDFWGRRPLHISGRGRAAIMDWARFNEALSTSAHWTEDSLKLYVNTRAALRENYCDVSGGRPAPADPRKVQALVGLGASLVANAIQRVTPELAAVASMLGVQFAARTGVNAYCSFKEVRAFQTHFDLHDVFALQVEGEKRWNIYEARADNPTAPVPPGDEAEKWLIATRGATLFQADMKPGDLLYLPRGWYHDALASSDASLHLTFWVQPATGLSLFDLLKTWAEKNSVFRADLPHPSADLPLREHLGEIAAALSDILTSPHFAIDVANEQRGRARMQPAYILPEQRKPRFFTVTQRSQVSRDDRGWSLGSVELGPAYPAAEWLMQQRLFSREEVVARFGFVDERDIDEMLSKFEALGLIERTELQPPPRT